MLKVEVALVEPTHEMVKAGAKVIKDAFASGPVTSHTLADAVWKAMQKARPELKR